MTRQRLIVQIDPPHNSRGGDWFYRTFAPGRAMSALDGVYVVNCDRVHREAARLVREADVLVLNSVCDADLFPVIADRTARGAVTVFEVSDDFSAIQPWNPIFHFFQSPANVRLYKQLARASTAIQCTTPELARLYGHLGRDRRVFINHLLDVPAPRGRERNPGSLVVGWGGSSGHLDDMARVAPALTRWVRETPSVTLSLMCSDSIWDLFASLPAGRKRRTKTGTIDDYYRFVATLDVGLAPLGDTAFNRSRSDVKFVEYAAYGAVALLQDLLPYQGVAVDGTTARFYGPPEELVARLGELARSPDERARLRAAAYQQVSRDRRQSDHAAERSDYYASLDRATGAPSDAPARLFEEVRAWRGAEVRGRHAVLGHTRVEQRLHDALVLAQHAQRHAEARKLLADAARECPSLDLPHLYAGSLFGDERELGAALERNPRSVTARIALGRVEVSRGNMAQALGQFVDAIELAPGYDEPYRLAAAAAERLGAASDARGLLAFAERIVADIEARSPGEVDDGQAPERGAKSPA